MISKCFCSTDQPCWPFFAPLWQRFPVEVSRKREKRREESGGADERLYTYTGGEGIWKGRERSIPYIRRMGSPAGIITPDIGRENTAAARHHKVQLNLSSAFATTRAALAAGARWPSACSPSLRTPSSATCASPPRAVERRKGVIRPCCLPRTCGSPTAPAPWGRGTTGDTRCPSSCSSTPPRSPEGLIRQSRREAAATTLTTTTAAATTTGRKPPSTLA